jgi:hypothetical protein
MILKAFEVEAMLSKTCTSCKGVSTEEVKMLAKSHEELRALLRVLKRNNECWCGSPAVILNDVRVHDNICKEIQRRVT